MQNNPYSTPQSEVEDVTHFDCAIVEEPLEEIKRPWLSIWTRPRATIRYLVATQPTRYVLLLALISGLSQNLNGIDERHISLGFTATQLMLICAVAAPITGWIGLYLFAAVLGWTGTWIGGRARPVDLRCAIAWAGIASIPILVCIFAQLLLLGDEAFLSDPASLSEPSSLLISFAILELMKFALSIWWTVLLIKCIAQVQGFSAWRGVGNGLLALAVVFFGFTALALVIMIPFAFLGALQA